ncbi:MAG: ATP-binding protein [Candidatus Hodarchaeota archaeon]
MKIIQRNIQNRITEALHDRPVVLLNGARQTGKSTLIQEICKQGGIPYFTLDDFTVLSAIQADPSGFLSGIKGPVALDEVQRVPELFLAIKAEVDKDRSAGRFLLTGSANVMFLPRLSEMLVGRMEILSLWPFSTGEILGKKERFLDILFSDQTPFLKGEDFDRKRFFYNMVTGGYPEVLKLDSDHRKIAWFQSYISTLVQRDVKDLSRIEGLSKMPRLLSLLAEQVGCLLNMSGLSKKLGISNMTLKRYARLFQAIFIAQLLPAWFGNVGKRLIKAPKVFLNDTGVLTFLLGLNVDQLLINPHKTGPVLENFVLQELNKQKSWSDIRLNLCYYRTATGKEVDFVLESLDGRIVGIEVKSASAVQSIDFKGLYDLSESVGDRFHRGVVLYLGDATIPFGENLHAMPIRGLWM